MLVKEEEEEHDENLDPRSNPVISSSDGGGGGEREVKKPRISLDSGFGEEEESFDSNVPGQRRAIVPDSEDEMTSSGAGLLGRRLESVGIDDGARFEVVQMEVETEEEPGEFDEVSRDCWVRRLVEY